MGEVGSPEDHEWDPASLGSLKCWRCGGKPHQHGTAAPARTPSRQDKIEAVVRDTLDERYLPGASRADEPGS